MTEIEVLKKKLERACEVHRVVSKPKPPSSTVSLLGLVIHSSLWSDDADDMIEALPNDIDDMWKVFENWFKGLDRNEKLVVLFRSSGMGYKRLAYVLRDSFKVSSVSRAMLSIYYARGLKKVCNNAVSFGLYNVFKNY